MVGHYPLLPVNGFSHPETNTMSWTQVQFRDEAEGILIVINQKNISLSSITKS